MGACLEVEHRLPKHLVQLLTATERRTLDKILPHLHPGENRLVMAKIGVSRSAACHVLKLLEAAGILTSRSLGRKGMVILVGGPVDPPAVRLARLLSVSERRAAAGILSQLGPDRDNVVVTAKVAEQQGTARASACQAMRKLEAAGLVQTRSLGPRGLLIRILDDAAVRDLLEQIKNT